MRTSYGYTYFFKWDSTYASEWGNFSSACQKIHEDDNGKPPSDQPNQSHDNPRESHDKLKEVHSMPYQDKDLKPLKTIPIPSNFNIQCYKEHLEYLAVAMVLCKQASLSTIHEQLGQLSFHRLKLLYRSWIISKELANMDAPICPGCAYGKLHHKPTQSKGVNNKKQWRTVTATGQVVRVDQLVSPTPGFIPTHQGRPTTQQYFDATVFVDHFYNFAYINIWGHLIDNQLSSQNIPLNVCANNTQ